MKTALIIFTYSAFLVCGKAAPRPWDPLSAIGNVFNPIVEGKKAAANNIITGISKLFQGDIPAAINHGGSAIGDVVKGDTEGLSTGAQEVLSIFGVNPTAVPPQSMDSDKSSGVIVNPTAVPSQSMDSDKSSGVIGSSISKIGGNNSNFSGGKIISTPVNNSPISNVQVKGQKPGGVIGSSISDITLADGVMENTNIKSMPQNNSPISNSKFENTDGVIGSAISDIKLGKGNLKDVNIESVPVNNSPITGSSFGG